MVNSRTFSLEVVEGQLGSNPAVATSFFFLSSFFYPLAFYCLFSLFTPLASRDFCENVFLVMLVAKAFLVEIKKLIWMVSFEMESKTDLSNRKK